MTLKRSELTNLEIMHRCKRLQKDLIPGLLKGSKKTKDFEILDCLMLYYLVDMIQNGHFKRISDIELHDIVALVINKSRDECEQNRKEFYTVLERWYALVDRLIEQYPKHRFRLDRAKICLGSVTPTRTDGIQLHMGRSNHMSFRFYIEQEKSVPDAQDVYIDVMLIPNLTSLNFLDILMRAAARTYVLQDPLNDERLNNRLRPQTHIKTMVLTLTSDQPIELTFPTTLNNKFRKLVCAWTQCALLEVLPGVDDMFKFGRQEFHRQEDLRTTTSEVKFYEWYTLGELFGRYKLPNYIDDVLRRKFLDSGRNDSNSSSSEEENESERTPKPTNYANQLKYLQKLDKKLLKIIKITMKKSVYYYFHTDKTHISSTSAAPPTKRTKI